MADYPAYPQKIGSRKDAAFGTNVDVAVSGKPRLQSRFSRDWSVFRIVHECDTAEKDAILSHYDVHKNVSFAFTCHGDSVVYTVKYANIPQARTGNLNFEWEVNTTLVQV